MGIFSVWQGGSGVPGTVQVSQALPTAVTVL